MEETPKSARSSHASAPDSAVFTAEERAAMREHAQERRAAARRRPGAEEPDGERDVRAKLAELTEPDRSLGTRLHAIIRASAPALVPRLWYGMPAYSKDGQVLCFFQPAQKFKTRYATLGFSDEANLDDGTMWPTAFALKELAAHDEARITALLKRAVS